MNIKDYYRTLVLSELGIDVDENVIKLHYYLVSAFTNYEKVTVSDYGTALTIDNVNMIFYNKDIDSVYTYGVFKNKIKSFIDFDDDNLETLVRDYFDKYIAKDIVIVN